jgi:hypothetical protein
MKTFMLSVVVVYAALFATMGIMERESLRGVENQTWRALALSLFCVPVLITWLSAELVNVISPRTVFHRGTRRTRSRLFAGLVAGGLGVGISVFSLTLLVEYADDTVLIGASAASGATLVLLPLRKVREGRCCQCDYDLSGNAGSSVCPECGRDVMSCVLSRQPARTECSLSGLPANDTARCGIPPPRGR